MRRPPWIFALDPQDIPQFAAEYALSGPHRKLEKPDWDAVMRIVRPADED
jgi:hypothetical protein